MKERKILALKSAIFVIGILVLSVCFFCMPELGREIALTNPEYAYLRFPVLIGLDITLIPFLFALYQAYQLLIYIEKQNPFSKLAISSLGGIKFSGITIIGIYIIGMVFLLIQNALHPGIAILGIVIIFAAFVISLFAAVLQELLGGVIKIKTENDLTV